MCLDAAFVFKFQQDQQRFFWVRRRVAAAWKSIKSKCNKRGESIRKIQVCWVDCFPRSVTLRWTGLAVVGSRSAAAGLHHWWLNSHWVQACDNVPEPRISTAAWSHRAGQAWSRSGSGSNLNSRKRERPTSSFLFFALNATPSTSEASS